MDLEIPYEVRGDKSKIILEYRENTSLHESGFDALLDLGFDPSLCLGYPTMHAWVENDLKGARRYCGWIQICEFTYYSRPLSELPDEKNMIIDVTEDMHKCGLPYCAFGCPAEIYDAPCNNRAGRYRLDWKAYTYLVDMPCRLNHNRLSFLAGFSWGYTEFEDRPVVIHAPEVLTEKDWERHFAFIKTQCPICAK